MASVDNQGVTGIIQHGFNFNAPFKFKITGMDRIMDKKKYLSLFTSEFLLGMKGL